MDWIPPSRKRALTAEEAELWGASMRNTRALRRRERAQAAGPSAKAEHGQPLLSPRQDAKAPVPAAQKPVPPQAAVQSAPIARLDEKQRRRLSKSRDAIDARLDLHGFRQRDAYTALRAFIFSAAARGDRHVLVITGKGVRTETSRDFFVEERGVLRRLVPQWLGEPEMRAFVSGYTASHIRHGGEGALYVKLRRPASRSGDRD